MSTPNVTTAAPAAPVTTPAPVETKSAAPAGDATPAAPAAPAKSVFAKEVPEGEKAPEKALDVQPVDLELPAGFDAKAGETLKTLAGKLGLDKTKGAELVKAYTEANAAAQKVAEERFTKQTAEWKSAARADPAIEKLGGFEKVVRTADRVLTRFDVDGKLSEVLEGSGLAFHPAVVRFFGELGAALKEDTVSGAPSPGATRSQSDETARLKALYPQSPKMFAHLKE